MCRSSQGTALEVTALVPLMSEGSIYHTRNEAKADLFDYMEMFYNRSRRHSHLGGVSPEAFEQASRNGSQPSTIPGAFHCFGVHALRYASPPI